MKLRTEIVIACVIAATLATYALVHALDERHKMRGSWNSDVHPLGAMTRPYGTDCYTTKQANCYAWRLTVTKADGGQQLSFGYFHSKAECEAAIPHIEAEKHATNGECVKPPWPTDRFRLYQ